MNTPESSFHRDQTVSIDLRSRANTVALYSTAALLGELVAIVPGSFLLKYTGDYSQAIGTGYSLAVGVTIFTAAAAAIKNSFEVPEHPIELGEIPFPTSETE